MTVFNEFIFAIPNKHGVVDLENGPYDASQIISKKCFEKWQKSRTTMPKSAEHSFQRTISAHVTGLDGRKPFPKPVEAAVLRVIRKRGKWPCFGNGHVRQGFRAKGFHEKAAAAEEKRLRACTLISSTTTPVPTNCLPLPLVPSPLSGFAPERPELNHLSFPIAPLLPSPVLLLEEKKFLQSASELLAFARTNADGNVWERVFQLGKIQLLCKGWNHPTMINAERILSNYDALHSAVVLFDLIDIHYRDVVVAASLPAQLFLGQVTRQNHGFDSSLFSQENDRWNLLVAIVCAFTRPGQEVACQAVLTKGTYSGVFELRVCVFKQEHVLAVRGWPA
ncbi:hypothetical protein BASA81_000366 [Batrachochytrium salamandrivorans]|nr:hypothetical protein BASA81_000366 [Batrachochytrium salamandrivorans]